MKKAKLSIIALIIATITFTTACNVKEVKNNGGTNSTNSIEPADFRVTENKDIYKNEKLDLQDIYVTVLDKNSNNWTLSDINNFRFNRQLKHEDPPSVEVIFHGSRPTDNIQALKSNAVLQPRGHGSGLTVQKSFKIKLNDNAASWNGQKTLNLNKHPDDLIRVRNKLSFDYFKLIPNYFSFRTQFTHLYIRDLSSSNKDFVDYGLFTHIEQPNKQYLKSHGIAEEAYMYKAEFFEFFRYKDSIKNVDEPGYNEQDFEVHLEIEGIEEHSRLIKMLDDVNNENKNINDVINEHFDRDNYITWMALNLITGNHDTSSQNFILVSPVTSRKWYFVPWDYDSAWGIEKQLGKASVRSSWQLGGVSNYWGVVLHRRFLKDEKNRDDLSKKIEECASIMNKETTEKLLKQYYDLTNKYIKSEPDIKYLKSTLENYEAEFKRMPGVIEENKKNYYYGLQKPMPIFLGEPKSQNNAYKFNWDPSYDFQGDNLYYNFKLSKNPEFTQVIVEKNNLIDIDTTVEGLTPGKYFWKVETSDSKGNTQTAFDYYRNENGVMFEGVKLLEIR